MTGTVTAVLARIARLGLPDTGPRGAMGSLAYGRGSAKLHGGAALTQVVALRRARGAPPREEPLPSYGDSARGRPRSRLAGGWLGLAHSRLGSVRLSKFRLSKFAAALTQAVGLRRARGAPPRVEPPVSYGDLTARPLAIEIGRGGSLVSLAPGSVGTLSKFRLSKFAAALTQADVPRSHERNAVHGPHLSQGRVIHEDVCRTGEMQLHIQLC